MNKKQRTIIKHEYAELIAKEGINTKRGELVEVTLTIDDLEFNYILVEELYKAGASRVFSHLHDSYMDRVHYLYGNKKELSKFYDYKLEKLKFFKDKHVSSIITLSPHFDDLEGIDPNIVREIKFAKRKKFYKFHSGIHEEGKWCCFAIPNISWAKKIFPDLSEKRAVSKLWQAILKSCHVSRGKTISNWQKHDAQLKRRANWLTSLNIKELHYTSKNGTDLRVGISSSCRFCGGSHDSNKTALFNPNFPTEEVFTSPDRDKTNGIVYASEPLVIDGSLIENISLKFENGKVVEANATKNKKLLLDTLKSDEGASYLGECALVPFKSPINNLGILFYETLFDENACCHLALGSGFFVAIKNPNGKKFSDRQMANLGINRSKIHYDFMIGTSDLNIVALTRSGKKVQIFKNGNWVK